ncbi:MULTISPECIES: DNA gyrase inhibitor YacG [unclassified Bradyrhizobium]|uniref:DNA gyrase inhibitor YacG n=1 Tax=unclassified Bradyrhizobium TaxID=2631580 RepID=UPI002478FA1F|nr:MULTISPECIES: DNA gyrase inhibitor YacG [unclassified Bradyrhizobium]WGS21707.1 DNA gyrase inhibitor YacG [Bradyrhizobium sp. ISRA463]WGS28656.1 DNA gyrase inhibitor YacG [Bradyrhizobium sp. ISRA464]
MDDQARKPSGPARPCPICGKPAEQAFRPFCSPRCRDVDLNRWLSGAYVVPGREDDEEDPE